VGISFFIVGYRTTYLNTLISIYITMGKMLVDISDEVEKAFKTAVIQKYGKLRGQISKVVEEAIKLWLEKSA